MYYAKELFVKRGPLATLWLAGSLLRKVSKQAILQADVEKLCSVVSSPPVVLALPAQSTLLRGVVRIENKKALYLLEDCEHTTGRLTQPRAAKETTLDPKKLKASNEKITYTSADQAALDEERFTLDQVDEFGMAMLVDDAAEFALFDSEEGDKRLSHADLSAYKGLAEDVTLGSQDLGAIGMEDAGFESLDYGIAQDDYGMGEFGIEPEFGGGEEGGFGAPVPPSPAVSELASVTLDLESYAMPVRQKKKKSRTFLPIIDEVTEIDDAQVRRHLHEVNDILVARPLPGVTARRVDDLETALQQPASVNPADFAYVPQAFIDSMARECRAEPIVDIKGHTPYDLESEFGGERGWEMEEGSFGFEGDISEGREREFMDFEQDRGAEEESFAMEGAEAEAEAEGAQYGLFAGIDVSQQEGRRGRVSGKGVEMVSEMETPEYDVAESQFELPHVEIAEKRQRTTIERRAVNKHTEIFRSELEKKFAALIRKKAEPSIVFDAFLHELLGSTPGLRDRALAFYQLLVLTSLEVINVDQPDDFGEITITKGTKFLVRWSSSQMFGSTTPSQ